MDLLYPLFSQTSPLESWPFWMRSVGSPRPQTNPSWRRWFRNRAPTPSSTRPRSSKMTLTSPSCTMLGSKGIPYTVLV
uniref:Uncharacterized protein n=1 Tax=Anguilla anguilla TaxID=7936 RepID=A0A0E9W038_ANGAN